VPGIPQTATVLVLYCTALIILLHFSTPIDGWPEGCGVWCGL
jgi:hypothetical protein